MVTPAGMQELQGGKKLPGQPGNQKDLPRAGERHLARPLPTKIRRAIRGADQVRFDGALAPARAPDGAATRDRGPGRGAAEAPPSTISAWVRQNSIFISRYSL